MYVCINNLIWTWHCHCLLSWANMKHNIVPVRKLALVTVVFCTAMFAFSQNASAERRPMPHGVIPVPDGGATIMLLGAALGSLGMARRFLKK